jgi:type VI secretion system secreted protein Hcp
MAIPGSEPRGLIDAYWKADTLENESEVKGKEKYSRLLGFEWGMSTPIDLRSGNASGRRDHKPLIIRKHLDKTTALTIDALVKNSTLAKSELIVMAIVGKDPKKVDKFKVSLEHVRVIDCYTVGGGEEGQEIVDTVKLSYEKITYEDIPGKKIATDDWRDV